LIEFKGRPPSRRVAMVWRKSSAMDAFLKQLAAIFRQLPVDLLNPHSAATLVPAAKASLQKRKPARR
jgi:LysR family hydrogen peroxide-inducible transcriptional activator